MTVNVARLGYVIRGRGAEGKPTAQVGIISSSVTKKVLRLGEVPPKVMHDCGRRYRIVRTPCEVSE